MSSPTPAPLQNASATARGAVSTGAQSLAGHKLFTEGLSVISNGYTRRFRPPVNLLDHVVEGDDTATVLAGIAAAIADGSRTLICPGGLWTFDMSDILADDGTTCRLPIPSQFTLRGAGPSTIFKMIGLDGGANADSGRNMVGIVSGAEDSLITGILFQGENGVEDAGFQFVENNTSSAISFLLTNNATNRCRIENCYFENLWGFPIHSPGIVVGCDITDNYMYWCANGPNVNGHRTKQNGNHLYKCEGFEVTGCNNQFIANTLTDCLGAAGFSIGGDQSPGTISHGCQVIGNIIDGVTKPGLQSFGITLGNSTIGCIVKGNNIQRCTGYAIACNTDLPGALCEANRITNNVCLNNSDNSGSVGAVLLAGTGNHVFENNTVRNMNQSTGSGGSSDETGFSCEIGIVVACDGSVIKNNILGGTNYGIIYQAGAKRCEQSGNEFPGWENPGHPDTISVAPIAWGAGCTTVIASEYAFALADYAAYTRVNGHPYTTFIRYGDGKQEWGSGDSPPDVNFKRLRAGMMGSEQKLGAVGGLAVGNRLAATTLGTVTGAVELFDTATGASLGKFALYDNIT